MNILQRVALLVLLALGLSMAPAASLAEPALQARPVVNINQASAAELAEALEGVGLTRAEAIVADREQHGPYASAEDLRRVSGIGPATIERNKSYIHTD
ncbi:helix-hairpin-helix domain-containing protein [Alcanivorax sp. JB21]|uniref:ComEA family DNA-binding protein n=1 Tax=Alcanivorax limicola TaxID=2874102 RepID=UPI001CBE8743|nr:helix-hairpin-helix domain-containing protein [Alcanivorax limicola]MBZ2188154.1 helix-hairpin-helix domain-containing protein [Alcanivorax limicola]